MTVLQDQERPVGFLAIVAGSSSFFRSAFRLLRTNPLLFARRLQMLLRHPLLTMAAMQRARRSNAQIVQNYQQWLAAITAPPEVPTDKILLLSILLPVHDPPDDALQAAINSVLDQTYPHWELCIADDASTRPSVRALLERYATADARIRVVYRPTSGHIAEASNSALALARGEFVALLDHDDVLDPDALGMIAEAVAAAPLIDLLYSDEDKLSPEGERIAPFFKPAWSPTLLLSCNYVTHLAAARRELVLAVGGFRTATVGSQDHDLFLRLAERARAIAHLPRILYSWRMVPGSTAGSSAAKPYAITAARRALGDAIARRGLAATLEPSHLNGLFVLRRRPPERATVSLIVTGTGTAWRSCLGQPGCTIRDMLWLPAGGATPPAPRLDDPPRVASFDALSGEYFVWLAADARCAPGALVALLAQAQLPAVGLVGGATLRDGAVQQAGIIIGTGGQPRHAFAGLPALPQRHFYLNLKDLAREVSAVALGGSALRRATWRELGGWRPDLPPQLAHVDLALRALEQGYATIFTPLARFTTGRPTMPLPEVAHVAWPWHAYDDPFWNPNLDPDQPTGLPLRHPERARARVRYRHPRGGFVSTLLDS